MRVLVAHCEIAYAGRLDTRLAPGDRVVLFKDDGSVCVHALKGAKPINYMPGPTVVEESDDVIRVRRPASGETLTILLLGTHADHLFELVDDAALERQGREKEIQALLARALHLIEPGLVLVERERPTDVGPVDLFCRDTAGAVVLVEVKRVRAVATAVEQVIRYREQVDLTPSLAPARAIVAAPDFAPQARVLAEARGVECVVFDPALLRGASDADLTLF
ncbi:MAG: endonuclease [Gaiellales bacterium]|nr:endonuclease [Gaiellales bacterium]